NRLCLISRTVVVRPFHDLLNNLNVVGRQLRRALSDGFNYLLTPYWCYLAVKQQSEIMRKINLTRSAKCAAAPDNGFQRSPVCILQFRKVSAHVRLRGSGRLIDKTLYFLWNTLFKKFTKRAL